MKPQNIIFIFLLTAATITIGCQNLSSGSAHKDPLDSEAGETETATFAGGCFWCMQAPFESLQGVEKVIAGYAGGKIKSPSYEEVSTGNTGFVEAVQVVFNPAVISYSEVLNTYWKQFDPTDTGGSFHDRGSQYKSVIFYRNNTQKEVAENSKKLLNESGIFKKPIATEIKKFTTFYPAEKYHQDYYKKNPVSYELYRKASGRDAFIMAVWGDENISKYKKPSEKVIKEKLSTLQYDVTQNSATEPAFENKYWNNHKEGIYVDVVSGEPLFSSTDKFNSGTGWPSFTKPIDPRYVVKKIDNSLGMVRVAVNSRFGGSHLGHLFDDGPAPTNLRYCINSAALKFIPKDEMAKDGYGDLLWLFN